VRQVEAFTQTFPKNRFLITSRIVGYREAPLAADYQVYTLADFDSEQIKSFIQQWCPAYERWVKGITDSEQLQRLATSEAEKTFQSIQRKPAVGKLTVNPLLLTIVALIQRQGIELPSHRIELFDLCAMTLIDTWVKAKGFTATSTFSRNNLIKLLCPLAFWMHQHPAISAIPEDELTEQVVNQLLARKITRHEDEAARLAEEFLDIVRGKTGILIERGKKRYGFLHLTFEEYFAARELEIRDDRDDFIKAHLHESRWREVILLTVGSIGTLHSNEKGVTSVVKNAILHAGSRYEEWLHRDLLFAGACLADDAGVSIECEEQILEQSLYLYLTSPYDSLRTAIDEVINQWSGMYLASKVAKIVLCLLQKRGLGTDIPLRGVRVSAPEVMHLARKLEDYCEQKVQEYNNTVMNLFHGMLYASSKSPEKLQKGKDLLLGLLTCENWCVRQVAVAFLAQVGRNDEEVLASLLPLIADNDSDVQKEVAQALGEIGQGDKRFIAGLLQLVDDVNQNVRQSAMLALAQVRQDDVLQGNQKMLQMLTESSQSLKIAAIQALTQSEQSDPKVVQALLKVLWDSDANVKKEVIAGLGRVGQNVPEVLPVLFSFVTNDDLYVRIAVAGALGQLVQTQPEIIDSLLDHIADEDWQTRQTMALALGFTNCKETRCTQSLIGLLADIDLEVQQAAVRSLALVGMEAPQVIDGLLDMLASPAINIQQDAIQSLGKIGQGNPKVVTVLLKLSTDANTLIRHKTVEALGWVGQAELIDSQVVTTLLTTLSDTNPDVRKAGVNAIQRLKIVSQQVIDAFLKLLVDNDVSVRKAAIVALGELGQDKLEVLTAFFQLFFEETMVDEEKYTAIREELIEMTKVAVQAFIQQGKSYAGVISALSILLEEIYQNEKPKWQQVLPKALKQLTEEQLELFASLLFTLQTASTPLTGNWKKFWDRIVRKLLTSIEEAQLNLDIFVLERLLRTLRILDYHPPEIVTTLLSFLTDQRWQIRLATVQILELIKADQLEVIEALLKLCSDVHVPIKLGAIQLLGDIGRGQRHVVEGLISVLSDSNWQVRQAVIEALGHIGHIGEGYIEVREQLLLSISDNNSSVQESAIVSLIQLEQDEKRILDLFTEVLSSSLSLTFYNKDKVRQAIWSALERNQSISKAQAHKNFLFELLYDKNADWHRRYASALILGHIEEEHTEIYFKLLDALPQMSISGKPGIIIALGKVGQRHPEVADVLLKLTNESDRSIKQALAQTFANLRLEQPEAIYFLYTLLFDTTVSVRQAAIKALGQLEREEPHVIGRLLQLLTDISFSTRQAVVVALGAVGVGKPEVIDGLLKCLFDTNYNIRSATLTALGQVSNGEARVVDALLRVIVSQSSPEASEAAETLASLPINRVKVSEQIEQLLQYYGPLTRGHVEGDGAVNNLLFALQQLVD
jgi:HEAT repeat protein